MSHSIPQLAPPNLSVDSRNWPPQVRIGRGCACRHEDSGKSLYSEACVAHRRAVRTRDAPEDSDRGNLVVRRWRWAHFRCVLGDAPNRCGTL